MPDHRQLLTEFRQLERRPTGNGRDIVDHPVRAHDDMANAVCGALWAASKQDVVWSGLRVATGLSKPSYWRMGHDDHARW